MNLAGIIAVHAQARPDKIAVVDGDRRIAYAELGRLVEARAGWLAAAGTGPGDRIGLCLRDHADHLILHYAVARLGAVILPMDHRWSAEEKVLVAGGFRAACVIVDADAGAIPGVRCLALGTGSERSPPPMPTGDGPLLLSLSSGTTGTPSGTVVSHGQMYERFVAQWVSLGFNGRDRYLAATPLYFGGGRAFAMGFLAAGATVILFPPPHEPAALIEAVNRHAATVTFVVPTMLRRLLPVSANATPAMPSLRALVTSGATIHPDERRAVMERLSPNLFDYYASTEGGGISILPPEEQLAYPDTVGRPTFRVDVEVVDDNDRPLPPGDAGRLRYRGPGVSAATIFAGGADSLPRPDGWFYPGDIATIAPSGHLRLLGRAKDLIIRGGVNIYPAEVERALLSHPGIAEAAVVGRPSPEFGEEVLAFVVPTAGGTPPKTAELFAHCRARLAPYKVPSEIRVRAVLPKNSAGKILKTALRTE